MYLLFVVDTHIFFNEGAYIYEDLISHVFDTFVTYYKMDFDFDTIEIDSTENK